MADLPLTPENLNRDGLAEVVASTLRHFGRRQYERLQQFIPDMPESRRDELIAALNELQEQSSIEIELRELLKRLETKPSDRRPQGESALQLARSLGVVGCAASGHADYSTNPAHMEGFGR